MYACGPQICTSALQGKFLNNKAQIIKLMFFTHSLSSSGCFTSEPQCPHWLVSLYVYRSGNDTHCSAKGPCSRHACTHTHTHTETVCTIACTCNQTQTNRHVHAQKHTFTALHLHTQTHIRGQVSRWHSSTLANTHTQTRAHTHAEQGGQMESQRGLLAFHTLETWFLTVSSPSPTLIPLFPHPTYPLSSSRSHLCQHTSPCFFFCAALSFCSQILALYISINSRCQLSMHLSSLFSLPCH